MPETNRGDKQIGPILKKGKHKVSVNEMETRRRKGKKGED